MAVVSRLSVLSGDKIVSVDKVSDSVDIKQYIQYKSSSSEREDKEDPFVVVDLGRLITLHDAWNAALPRVHPFYAVKCNNDALLLKTLAAMDVGFDCASKIEIQSVLDLGVSPGHIVYANPCKQVSHVQYASNKGVSLMTFDNEFELYKVKMHFPAARLVLRLRADDPDAICQLGIKYGCSVSVGKRLLHTACTLSLNVVGVSFHVGSGCQTPSAYQSALELSQEVFQYASHIGYNFTLLDIGGGFPGHQGSDGLFSQVSASINQGLDKFFNPEHFPDLKIIAEPGRYFACSTHTIAVNVISKRLHREERAGTEPSCMYYVNDGVYGSFNCVLYDHTVPTPSILKAGSSPSYSSSIWGPTCDGLDKICEAILPELDMGDWIYFRDMGAYTLSAFSPFNGFIKPTSYYYVTESDSKKLEGLHSVCSMEEVISLSQVASPYLLSSSSATLSEKVPHLFEMAKISQMGHLQDVM